MIRVGVMMRTILFCLLFLFFGEAFGQDSSSQPTSASRPQASTEEGDIEYRLTLQKKEARRASLSWFGAGGALFLGSLGAAIILEETGAVSSSGVQGPLSVVLLGAGTVGSVAGILGTSAGYFKAGDKKRGRRHLTIQGVSMGVMVASAGIALLALDGVILEDNNNAFGGTLVVGAASTAVLGGCTLWNLYNVGRSPRRLYEARLSLMPRGLGLSLGGGF